MASSGVTTINGPVSDSAAVTAALWIWPRPVIWAGHPRFAMAASSIRYWGADEIRSNSWAFPSLVSHRPLLSIISVHRFIHATGHNQPRHIRRMVQHAVQRFLLIGGESAEYPFGQIIIRMRLSPYSDFDPWKLIRTGEINDIF